MYSVYTLSDPIDGQVRYVGISTNPYKRYGEHLLLSSKNQDKDAWIADLMDLECLPTLNVIERNLPSKEARQREEYWIKFYGQQGFVLLNAPQQGKPYRPLCPAKLNIREIRLSKSISQSYLAQWSGIPLYVISRIEHGGYVPSDEVIEKLAKTLKVPVEQILKSDTTLSN